jgi:4,5-DOPA dioxygenase extradiol
MLAVEENEYTQFLEGLGRTLKPKAILLFSAHWESDAQQIGAVDKYSTIYDFGGFPEELYRIQYPAPGDHGLAAEVGRLLTNHGFPCQLDQRRGLDHGAWVPLRRLFPDADVPVVAMSVNPDLAPQEQYAIGQALSGLRREDVLIIASGVTVHNFGTLRWRSPDAAPDAWAVAFDDWVLGKASAWDLQSLFAYESLAPNATRAVPPQGNEHFIPLFYALGAADDQRIAKELHRSYQFGNLSHVVWQFGG